MAVASAALRRPASNVVFAALAFAVAALVVAARLLLADAPLAQTFVLVFASIVIEALPFILLGAVVSALLAVYVPDRAFARLARLPLPLQLPAAAIGGLAFPVCECGSVPVARRLISKGLHASAGLAFMLASPILNPVVLASTVVAYRGRGVALEMVVGRALLAFVLALAAAWAIGGEGRALLRSRDDRDDHGHGEQLPRGHRFVEHVTADFSFMGRFLVAGAGLAAALQTLIPQNVVARVAGDPLLGALALMGLAFVLSLCSEADAFVAVSLTPFSLGAQLAFLVFGPVLDTKLAFLYRAAFARGVVLRLAVVAVPVVLAGSLWFDAVTK